MESNTLAVRDVNYRKFRRDSVLQPVQSVAECIQYDATINSFNAMLEHVTSHVKNPSIVQSIVIRF